MTIEFELTEDQQMMRDTVADFAKAKLRDRARDVEHRRALPDDLASAIAELGLTAYAIPEAAGGSGMGMQTAVLVEEELAFGDAAVPFAMPGPGNLLHALIELGSDEQQKRIFERFVSDPKLRGAVAWSESRPNRDRAGFSAVARKDGDGWVIDGKKSYVLGAGLASTYVVFAQVDESKGWDGIGAFVVDGANVEASERSITVGLDAASFGEITLKGARGERLEGRGDFARGLRRFFARQGLFVAARAVGLARAAWEVSRAYADERKAFGKAIGHFQSIAFLLADRHMDVEGARGLVARAAWTFDTRGNDDGEVLARSAEAIAEALEVVQQCGSDAVQIHGGAGFVRDYIVEKYMRDAKQLALCASSTTTSDQLFAAIALGTPLDPALVLPTPDLQPIFT
ncbi:MAG: acyl-CoA dehydrogenase family protein [Polyangiales bacterium]